MATPNYNDPRASTNAFSIGQQELLRLKNRIGFIEEAFEKLDDDPTDAIPTKLSELQNDVGFITADDIPDIPEGTIPTKTSDLTNDSGFVTSEDIPTKTSQLQNNSGFINSSGHIAFMETWKGDDTGTYGAEYLIRAKWHDNTAMFECGEYNVGCQYAETAPWEGIIGKPKTFYVNKSYTSSQLDSTHYSSLSDCVAAATQSPYSTIYVYSGTYELLTEHDADWWYNHKIADRYAGIELKNNVSIIGIGCDVRVQMTYQGSNNTYKEYLSPFCVSGSFRLENLNITSTECSYCVHDDIEISPHAEVNSTGYYINCAMQHNGRTNFTSGGSIDECIGGGGGRNGLRIIEGGVYECNPATCQYVISYHRNGIYDGTLHNTTINGIHSKTGTIYFSDFGYGQIYATVHGCKLATDIYAPSGLNSTIYLKQFDNEILSHETDAEDEYVEITYQTATAANSATTPIYGGCFINGVTGAIVPIAGNYFASDYIPCKKGDIFTAFYNLGSLFAVYDKHGNFLYGENGTATYSNTSFTISDDDAAYIRFSMYELSVPGRVVKLKTTKDTVRDNRIKRLTWDSDGVTQGYFIHYGNGTAVEAATLYATDYVNLNGCNIISFSFVQSTTIAAFYDADKQYISGIEADKNGAYNVKCYTGTVPENAVYARFTMDNPSDANPVVGETQHGIRLFYNKNDVDFIELLSTIDKLSNQIDDAS